jgi:hypothetical protein
VFLNLSANILDFGLNRHNVVVNLVDFLLPFVILLVTGLFRLDKWFSDDYNFALKVVNEAFSQLHDRFFAVFLSVEGSFTLVVGFISELLQQVLKAVSNGVLLI